MTARREAERDDRLPTALADAAGRNVRVGDTVGGTTSGRYQATIIGPIIKIGKGQVKVRVTSPGGDGACRPEPGAEKWISTDRIFLVDRKNDAMDKVQAALDEALRTTPATGHTHQPGEEKWDHHPAPGEQGHNHAHTCALCRGDISAQAADYDYFAEAMAPATDDEAAALREKVRTGQVARQKVRPLEEPKEAKR